MRLSSKTTVTIGPKKAGKRPFKNHWIIKDEKALATKQEVDRKLRQLARQMSKTQAKRQLRCHNCGRFLDPDWQFCPWDAAKLTK